jgi:hypothetical protein
MRFLWFVFTVSAFVVSLAAFGGERALKNISVFFGTAARFPRAEMREKLAEVVWCGCMEEVSFPEAPPGWDWSVVVTGADGVERGPNGVVADRYYVGDARAVKVLLVSAGGRETPAVPVRKSGE